MLFFLLKGGKAGWTKGKVTTNGLDYEGPGDKYMLQVRGTSALTCKAIQVVPSLILAILKKK